MIHGLCLIDKASGPTSHDVVYQLRKILKTKDIGHTGTLDPIASGLLIFCIGEATKLSQYLLEEDKSYKVILKLGAKSTTLDRAGEITQVSTHIPSLEKIKTEAQNLVGDFEWPIPIYSAKKIDGKKLYEFAHKGEMIELPLKTMSYSNVRFLSADEKEHLYEFEIDCKKGAFIRTWVDELGLKLGCGAYIQELRRTRVGSWKIEQAVLIDNLKAFANPNESLVPLELSLPSWERVEVAGEDLKLILNGQIPYKMNFQKFSDQVVLVDKESQKWLAIATKDLTGKLKLQRGFRY